MGERTITGYATSALKEKLRGLNLGSGLVVEDNLSSWVSGEVSIGDRKGKFYPIYSLEVEVPFSGTVNGALVKGSVHLPDLSLEMLDDLEVDLDVTEGSAADSVKEAAAEKVREAVRSWANSVRKAVGESLESLPLDLPSQARTPRAAALISEEESMSAAGAAELDDAAIEELPHPDDLREAVEEEEPFTEEEVQQLYDDARQALSETVDGADLEGQYAELWSSNLECPSSLANLECPSSNLANLECPSSNLANLECPAKCVAECMPDGRAHQVRHVALIAIDGH